MSGPASSSVPSPHFLAYLRHTVVSASNTRIFQYIVLVVIDFMTERLPLFLLDDVLQIAKGIGCNIGTLRSVCKAFADSLDSKLTEVRLERPSANQSSANDDALPLRFLSKVHLTVLHISKMLPESRMLYNDMLKKCPNLKELYIKQDDCLSKMVPASVIELDLSPCLFLKRFECADKMVKNVIFPQNALITDIKMSCHHTTTVDLSKCQKIKNIYVWGLKDVIFPYEHTQCKQGSELESITLYMTTLRKIDLSYHPNLKHVYLGGEIASVDFTGCRSLYQFNVSNCKLTDLKLAGCTSLHNRIPAQFRGQF